MEQQPAHRHLKLQAPGLDDGQELLISRALADAWRVMRPSAGPLALARRRGGSRTVTWHTPAERSGETALLVENRLELRWTPMRAEAAQLHAFRRGPPKA